MTILKKAFGAYQTNCYILKGKDSQIVIDPGQGADVWVKQECQNLVAILNTHGHFDHIWSNASLKEYFPNSKLVCPKGDAFMLSSDCFNLGLAPQNPDIMIGEESIEIGEFCVEFMFFPGHTPGCSMIKIDNHIFSGDFIFHRSIGRSDFEYSNSDDMKNSLLKFKQLDMDLPLHPGHGEDSDVISEQRNVDFWIKRL